MNENLCINQVEKLTGVSKRNIRFYEKEGGLLTKGNQGRRNRNKLLHFNDKAK